MIGVVRLVEGGSVMGGKSCEVCCPRSVLVMASIIWDVRAGCVVGAMFQAWGRKVRMLCRTV